MVVMSTWVYLCFFFFVLGGGIFSGGLLGSAYAGTVDLLMNRALRVFGSKETPALPAHIEAALLEPCDPWEELREFDVRLRGTVERPTKKIKRPTKRGDAMAAKPTVKVQQGVAKVNSGHVVIQSNEVILFKFDLKAKYAEVFGWRENEVTVGAGTDTLHKSKSKRLTRVSLTVPKGFNVHHAWVSRYTLSILAICDSVMYPQNFDKIWQARAVFP